MVTRILALVFLLSCTSACDVFPTKTSKKQEENEKWFDTFYGRDQKKDDSYCSFYGTCKKPGKSEQSSWDWWTGGIDSE